MNTDFLPVDALGERHYVERFDCGVEELDRFLRRTARTAMVVGTAATYVLCDAEPLDPTSLPESSELEGTVYEVVGYYSLAVRSIEQDLGPRLLGRGLPESVSVIQLSRFAIHRDCQGVGIGGELLVDALRRSLQAAAAMGARAVVVDAVDDAAYRFYDHFGFEELEGNRLFKSVPDLVAALHAAPAT